MIGGDFNLMVSDMEDRRHTTRSKNSKHTKTLQKPTLKTSVLEELLQHTRLIDTWRSLHPDAREYTHYSHSQNSFSRIDYFMLPPSIQKRTKDIDIHGISITDHALLSLKLQIHTRYKQQNIWRYPTYLKDDQKFIEYMTGAWEEYTKNNETHTCTPTLFWEAGKAFLRGEIIAYSIAYKKSHS